MRILLLGLSLLTLCLATCACGATYDSMRNEFDSLARFGEGGEEPADANELYQQYPLRRNLFLRATTWSGIDRFFEILFFMETAPSFVENPAGLAREDLVGMSDLMGGSLDRTVEVTVRLLWVFEYDVHHVLSRVEALAAAIRILERDGIDPITSPTPVSQREQAAARRLAERDLAVLQSLWPDTRTGYAAEEDRVRYTAALESLTRAPFVPLVVQRQLIRKLHEAWRLESDPVLASATEAALIRAVQHGLCSALYTGILSADTALRITALRGFNRLSGTKAVAFCLAYLSRPPMAESADWQYDRMGVSERRLLIQLCGQLRAPEIFEPFWLAAGKNKVAGPKPIDFLYDRVQFDVHDGLKLVALEAMAHCLGHRVEQESDWADAWWHKYAVEESVGPGAVK